MLPFSTISSKFINFSQISMKRRRLIQNYSSLRRIPHNTPCASSFFLYPKFNQIEPSDSTPLDSSTRSHISPSTAPSFPASIDDKSPAAFLPIISLLIALSNYHITIHIIDFSIHNTFFSHKYCAIHFEILTSY